MSLNSANSKNTTVFLLVVILVVVRVVGLMAVFGNNKDGAPAQNDSSSLANSPSSASNKDDNEPITAAFLGSKGTSLTAQDGALYIDESTVNDGNLHAFNYLSPSENKFIYFFVIRASDGTYRAAANACEVCFGSKRGFTQVGDLIRCDNCRTTYTKDQIALQKGGCNPVPINKSVPITGAQLVLSVNEVESVANYF